jgi:glycolate oxidase FAD binding subunit
MLAFEPFDCGPIFGNAVGASTIGGTVAAGISGSQRVSCGAVRDHFLGFRAVSGRAEVFAAGAKVVKNVTGYDLSKLAAGSWGRLFVLTELTLKVLPRPRESVTLALKGLDDAAAIRAMAKAMGSQAEVAAAAHISARSGDGTGLTLFRIQGFGASVSARCALLERMLEEMGQVFALTASDAEDAWALYRTLDALGAELPLWRISVPPSKAGELVASISDDGANWVYDWAGGLVWMTSDHAAHGIRQAAVEAGGHATLFRASASLRSEVPAFHPQPTGLAALEERVRRSFDPAGVFETGRF